MTTNPPDTSARLVSGNGLIDPVWLRWLRSVWRMVQTHDTAVTGFATSKAGTLQRWAHSVLIEAPANQSYVYPRLGVEGYITTVIAKTSSGSCDVTVSIDDNDLAGDVTSASTTLVETDHGIENLMVTDSDITITVSNNSSAADLSVTIIGQQTLGA